MKGNSKSSKFILTMAKKLVSTFNMKHLEINDILFLRSDITNSSKYIRIYRLPRMLIKVFNIYYVVEVFPTFDILKEKDMYKNIFHVLKHIPKNYKSKPIILPHDDESFTEEYIFNYNYMENLGWKK